MRSPRKSTRLPVRSILPLLACLGCDKETPGAYDGPEWLTELEYRFTGTAEQGVLFNWAYVRADPYQDRIFVLDPRETQVSAWLPDGSLVFVVGRKGEGPGEFTQPSRIYFKEDGGFTVREGWGTRFTHYTADGGLVGTEIGLTTALTYRDAVGGVGLQAPTGDGGYLATPRFAASQQAGLSGGPPMEQEPLLRVRRSENGHWLPPESIFWQNIRNSLHAVPLQDGHSFGGQYFGDADRMVFAHGKVLVMQLAAGPPGSLDLLELNAHGDTLWQRRLQFKPLKLTDEWVQEVIDIHRRPEFRFPGVTPAEHLKYLEDFEETLYKPEYMPASGGLFLSAADQVWIKTFERSDTLRVYYTIPRGDMSSEPRRVLLPESFSAEDATATHVWGTRDDPMGVAYVVGRRLKRPGRH